MQGACYFNMLSKDKLFDVESWLYDDYDSIDEILETIEDYYDEDGDNYNEFIDDVLNNYPPYDFDDADVRQIYDDFTRLGSLVEYYSEGGETYLELSDGRILWEIDADIDNGTYWDIADEFIDRFEAEYGVSDVGYVGRSGRHVVCPDTWENVVRYDDLVDGVAKYQQEFIDYINSNYGV